MTDDNGGVVKPITESVRALAGTPMLLALMLLNVMILGMITYLLHVRSDQIAMERKEMLEILRDCLPRHGASAHADLSQIPDR
jgi:hypothetical protein